MSTQSVGGGGARKESIWSKIKRRITPTKKEVSDRIPVSVKEVITETVRDKILKVDETKKLKLQDVPATKAKEYVHPEQRIKEVELSGPEGEEVVTHYYTRGKKVKTITKEPISKISVGGTEEDPLKETTTKTKITEKAPTGEIAKQFVETKVSLLGPPGLVVMREAELKGKDPEVALLEQWKTVTERAAIERAERFKEGKKEVHKQLIIIPTRAAGEFTYGFISTAPEALAAGSILGVTEQAIKFIKKTGGTGGKVATGAIRLGQLSLAVGGISQITTAWKESDLYGKSRIAGAVASGAYFTPKSFKLTTELFETFDISKVSTMRAQAELELIKETMKSGDTIIKTEGKITGGEITRQTITGGQKKIADLLDIDEGLGLYERPSGGTHIAVQEVPVSVSHIKVFGKQIVRVTTDLKTGKVMAFVSKGGAKGTAYVFGQVGDEVVITGFKVATVAGKAPKVKPFYTGKYTATPSALTITGISQDATTFAELKEPGMTLKGREAQIGSIRFGKGSVKLTGFKVETGPTAAIKETYLRNVQIVSDKIALTKSIYGRGPTMDVTQFVPVEYTIKSVPDTLPKITGMDIIKWKAGNVLDPVAKTLGKQVGKIGKGVGNILADEFTSGGLISIAPQQTAQVTPVVQLPSIPPSTVAVQTVSVIGAPVKTIGAKIGGMIPPVLIDVSGVKTSDAVMAAAIGMSDFEVGIIREIETREPSGIALKGGELSGIEQDIYSRFKREIILQEDVTVVKTGIDTKFKTGRKTKLGVGLDTSKKTELVSETGLVSVIPSVKTSRVQIGKKKVAQITEQVGKQVAAVAQMPIQRVVPRQVIVQDQALIPVPQQALGFGGRTRPQIFGGFFLPKAASPNILGKVKKVTRAKKKKGVKRKPRGFLVVPSPTVKVPVKPLKFQTTKTRRQFLKAGIREGMFLQFNPTKRLSSSRKKKKVRRKK